MAKVNDDQTTSTPCKVLVKWIIEVFSHASVAQGTVRMDKYDGESRNVVNWLEDYELIGVACGLDDRIRLRRFPPYLEKSAMDWYSVFVNGVDGMAW